MQAHDVFERPGLSGVGWRRGPLRGNRPQFRDRRLQPLRQLVEAKVQIAFERRKTRFGPLESADRAGCRDANLAQARGPFAQLLDWFLVQLPQRAQLVLHRVGVLLLGAGPAIQDVVALLDEMRQARFNRLKMFLRLLPLLERQAESIQLRFEFGETLFEVRTLLMHLPPCARDCCTKMRAPLVVFALGCAVHTPRKRKPRGAPMIVNRVARRFAMALASGFLVASDVAGQDALTRAKDLYASAAYDDALAVLDQLKLDSSSPDVVGGRAVPGLLPAGVGAKRRRAKGHRGHRRGRPVVPTGAKPRCRRGS